MVHAPDTHAWPVAHAVPQAPQLTPSLARRAQYGAPPSGVQSVWPAPQVVSQRPAAQRSPAPQVVKQPPQFRPSESVLAQKAAPASGVQSVVPGAQAGRQLPLWHTRPRPQATPHAPQLALSVAVLAQLRTPPSPVHVVSPAPQVVPHAPLLQTSAAAQVRPQAPQLPLSVWALTQAPPSQASWLAPHTVRHCEPTQRVPVAQAWPQPPQCASSEAVVTQRAPPSAPPHAVWPEGQFATQAPAWHSSPGAQARPHWPQWRTSTWVSAQVVPQLVSGQAGRQVPATQEAPAPQVVPQAPQLAGSERVSTQAPEQTCLGAAQPAWQLPPMQLEPAAHVVPQAPQLEGSDRVSTQAPLHCWSGAPQLAWQAPATQICPPPQAFPQAPQFFASTLMSTQTPLQSVQGTGAVAAQLHVSAASAAVSHRLCRVMPSPSRREVQRAPASRPRTVPLSCRKATATAAWTWARACASLRAPHAMTTLLLAVLLAQTTPPNAVVLARKSGVTAEQTAAVVSLLVTEFAKAGVPLAPSAVDGTSCKGKKACLVSLAGKRGLTKAVLLQVAKVLDDGVVTAECVAVEADGERLGSVDYEGPLADEAGLRARFTALAQKVAGGSKPLAAAVPAPGPATPPAPVAVVTPPRPAPQPAPAPVAVAPSPAAAPPSALTPPATPEPASAVAQTAAPGWLTPARGVGLTFIGLGVAAGIAGAIFGVSALDAKTKVGQLCPAGTQCNDPQAFKAFEANGQAFGMATGFFIGAGAAIAAGLVMVLAGAPASTTSSTFELSPSGLRAHF